ncbi:hypothetical protein [Bacillus sp. BP-3]|uniref:hypothetical protein n=1 Tax=Bacillus sp. BP-3 TaxID=3022773 RepID=UPI00232EBF73|nr:hypothetical protein [Bacillus sp. BP-3]MDC2867809.1 hypothetical protein [Bacillus sp. BP-3]
MKIPRYHHKVKFKNKQPDLISYFIKILLGSLPLICYLIIVNTLNNLNEVGISLSLPTYFFFIACLILAGTTFYTWFKSPLSFSKNQRMSNKLKKIIEVNKFYSENSETHKIILSMIIHFYWIEEKLYLEVYPNGGHYTHKMNDLTLIFQTALNMTVITVQDDYADHTTYILTKETSNFINATNSWE